MLTWALGVLMVPLWAGMLAVRLAQPERFAHDAAGSVLDLAWPIAVVFAGFVGIVGLLRVLTLSRSERPQRHRVWTICMVAIGLAGLAIFDAPWLGVFEDLSDGIPFLGLLIYVLLPFGGAAWLLAKSWRYLVARRPARQATPPSGSI
jgi:hypothetical protein